MTQPQQTNKSGCGPMLAWGLGIFLVLGLIGQACGDDDSYVPSGDSGCASAARAQEARGYDYGSEYEACVKMKAIVGD